MKFCSDCKHKYIMSQSPCTECRLFDKMEKGNPAVALLEKIITEIEEIDIVRINPYNNLNEYSVSTKELRELLDKYISELKGEQNDS